MEGSDTAYNGQIVSGGALFNYWDEVDPNTYVEGVKQSTCQSITVTVGVADQDADNVTGTGTLSVITENGTQTMQFHGREVDRKTFELGLSGAFEFSTTLDSSSYVLVYWNATLSCSTPNGQ